MANFFGDFDSNVRNAQKIIGPLPILSKYVLDHLDTKNIITSYPNKQA
jgi:hypothetical protein